LIVCLVRFVDLLTHGQAAERTMFHLLHISAGEGVLQRCSKLSGVDFEALNNFSSRSLSKLEASDDEEQD
jgi:hypothetical protein